MSARISFNETVRGDRTPKQRSLHSSKLSPLIGLTARPKYRIDLWEKEGMDTKGEQDNTLRGKSNESNEEQEISLSKKPHHTLSKALALITRL